MIYGGGTYMTLHDEETINATELNLIKNVLKNMVIDKKSKTEIFELMQYFSLNEDTINSLWNELHE